MEELIQIGKRKNLNKNGITRRDFLKGGAGASLLALTACADPARQHIYPDVKGNIAKIPGKALWYRSTCQECQAGCGVTVRTREGRAVKIEGNPEHSLSKGGLCALGQSALQALYDPDRVRKPLKKEGGKFKEISWEEALKVLREALNDSGEKYFISGRVQGSSQELVKEWSSKFNINHLVYDPTEDTVSAKASEIVFGNYSVPYYRIDKADFLLNFGADFLETWISPVMFARQWAKARRQKKPIKVFHLESRLSLTAANADKWIKITPEGHYLVALFIIKRLLALRPKNNLSASLNSYLKEITKDITPAEVEERSGVSRANLTLIVDHLLEAHSPLVLAGGSAVRFNSGLALSTAALLINVLLGSVGKTLSAKSSLVPQTDVGAISNFIKESSQVVKGSSGEVRGFKIRSVFIYNTNPVFTLPAEFAFPYALKRIKNKVCFSLTLDETAKMCDLILPVNHWLESWQDVENMLSEISFAQPVMRPIFNTKQFEEILLELLDRKEKKFLDYLKARWQKKTRKSGAAFEKWWRRSLERGIAKEADEKILSGGEARLNRSIVKELKQVKFSYKEATLKRGEVKRALLYPFFSLKFLDGRGANRAWLQELPDPVSQIVWDSWAEVHPDTAKEFKLKDGDQVIVRNEQGELHLHLRVTPHIVKGIVAVPAGQGHSEYGRFAKVAAGNGNLFSLLPKGEGLKFGPVKVELEDSGYRSDAVNVQGSDSQLGRGLARWEHLNDNAQVIREEGEEEEHHHPPKQMYVQREHPVYEWGMVIDLAACTGCSACVVGCFAENNVPVVGKKVCQEGREMSWIRIERYDDSTEEEVRISFLPMMCQHCNNAPCEPVCPVYATYHNEEGLNVMVYNRCVGTRYCSNNCTYKVRRFNWYEISFPHPMEMMLNPDVVKRSAGVMEKCTFCIQRIAEAKDRAKDEGRLVRDGEIQPACVQSCPTGALVFGNLKDKKSKVSRMAKSHRGYKILDHHINTQPSVTYLKDFRYKV